MTVNCSFAPSQNRVAGYARMTALCKARTDATSHCRTRLDPKPSPCAQEGMKEMVAIAAPEEFPQMIPGIHYAISTQHKGGHLPEGVGAKL